MFTQSAVPKHIAVSDRVVVRPALCIVRPSSVYAHDQWRVRFCDCHRLANHDSHCIHTHAVFIYVMPINTVTRRTAFVFGFPTQTCVVVVFALRNFGGD